MSKVKRLLLSAGFIMVLAISAFSNVCSYFVCFSGNAGACLDQGYDQTECFPVTALADCGGVNEIKCPARDGTRVNIY